MSKQNPSTLLGDDLNVSKIVPRAGGGSWVRGTVAGHRFRALVFKELCSEFTSFGIGDGYVANLSLIRLADGREVYYSGVGSGGITDDRKAKAIADLLTSGRLRDMVYPDSKSGHLQS